MIQRLMRRLDFREPAPTAEPKNEYLPEHATLATLIWDLADAAQSSPDLAQGLMEASLAQALNDLPGHPLEDTLRALREKVGRRAVRAARLHTA